ncbi:hypothetical protein RUM43_012334 [Polyplax serrata]|uniref:Uncharacterized protein n=1 Tax=Polyplax serrata TaxID=468196 RepID=A0AAN8PDF0_POLSC
MNNVGFNKGVPIGSVQSWNTVTKIQKIGDVLNMKGTGSKGVAYKHFCMDIQYGTAADIVSFRKAEMPELVTDFRGRGDSWYKIGLFTLMGGLV